MSWFRVIVAVFGALVSLWLLWTDVQSGQTGWLLVDSVFLFAWGLILGADLERRHCFRGRS